LEKYQLRQNIEGYVTNIEESAKNADKYLVSGSQNVLIDPRFSKFGSRGGYSRLGVANTALTPIRQSFDWIHSKNGELNLRWYDDELEVYLGTVGGQDIDAWTRIASSLSTTAIPRATTWWDTTEDIDLLLFVQGDDNIYEWSGAVATVSSVTGTTITKKGTNTFAQDRFYTTRNKVVVCVRTGTEYTYTGGEGTTTLTGITDTTDLVAGDILIQKVVTNTDKPVANRINNYIFNFENYIFVGSDTDSEVFMSKSTSFTTFTFSATRLPTEGGLFALSGTTKGFSLLSKKPIIFSSDKIYTLDFLEIAVGSTLAETVKVRELKTGSGQGAFNQESIVSIGDSIIYLTNETALRMLETTDQADQPQLKALSNPIKPDFDDETWTNAFSIWHKNRYYLSAPENSKVYILDYVETADGSLKRFWQPPQILPVRCFSIISGVLYGHSNAVPETYLLFNGTSDGVYDGMDVAEKLPINCIAKTSYRNYGDRANLKSHDEWYDEGNISASTDDLIMKLRYDFGGFTQESSYIINGTDKDIILEGLDTTSLGQQPLGANPIGGSNEEPPALSRFRVTFEMPKEDFNEIQEIFESNGVDKAWEIIASGGNVKISNNRNTVNRK
jgi:hypothetical protein